MRRVPCASFVTAATMASLLRSWARRAARLARDMQDVSPISATNEIVASFESERCVSAGWRAWSDAPHGGTSTANVRFETIETDDGENRAGILVLEGVLSTKTVAPLRESAEASSGSSTGDDKKSSSGRETSHISEDPESTLTADETNRSGYEMRLAAVATRPIARRGFAAGAEMETAAGDEENAVEPLKMRRSGFAGCSTVNLPTGEYIDLDAFTALRYRVRSDGRKYVVNVRTENYVTGGKEDLWQAFLFSPANVWANVYVPMGRFLKTWRGRVMEHEHEMNASRVVGLGFAVAGGGEVEPEGPFRLEIELVAGVRVTGEELELARRREEASWASGDASSGRPIHRADGSRGRSLEDDDDEADRLRGRRGGPAAVTMGSSSEDLLAAATRLRRAAEEDRRRIERVTGNPKPTEGFSHAKTKFKGEMLPAFLGRKPSEEK